MRCGDDRGQTTPLVVLVVLAAAGVLVLLASLGQTGGTRARAQTAADAAALAATFEGRSGAQALARANGADLISFESAGIEAEVVVEIDGVRATARARRDVDR